MFVGSDARAQRLVGASTQIVDLGGKRAADCATAVLRLGNVIPAGVLML